MPTRATPLTIRVAALAGSRNHRAVVTPARQMAPTTGPRAGNADVSTASAAPISATCAQRSGIRKRPNRR